jgi:hypothetical protein
VKSPFFYSSNTVISLYALTRQRTPAYVINRNKVGKMLICTARTTGALFYGTFSPAVIFSDPPITLWL